MLIMGNKMSTVGWTKCAQRRPSNVPRGACVANEIGTVHIAGREMQALVFTSKGTAVSDIF